MRGGERLRAPREEDNTNPAITGTGLDPLRYICSGRFGVLDAISSGRVSITWKA
jgi:hypothetical protein